RQTAVKRRERMETPNGVFLPISKSGLRGVKKKRRLATQSRKMAHSSFAEFAMHSNPATFSFDCSTHTFPEEEIRVLADRGAALEALAAGRTPPAGPEDEHFLRVDREELEPATLEERAWLRLKYRREFERDLNGPPPPPPENYGMIEWDKEKCWW